MADINNLAEILKKAELLQSNLQSLQNKLGEQQFTGSAGSDLVTAIIDGKLKPIHIEYSEQLTHEALPVLADLTLKALLDAHGKAERAAKIAFMNLSNQADE